MLRQLFFSSSISSFFRKYDFHIFILILFIIPLLPTFNTIDIIGAQWFYASVLNVSILLYLFIYKIPINLVFNLFSFKIYIFFCLLAFVSIFYANNYIVSLVDFFKIFNTICLIILLFSLSVNKNPVHIFKWICGIILISLFLDLLFSLQPIFLFFNTNYFFNPVDFSPDNFKGFYPNKNITSALICIKLSFLFFFINNIKPPNKFFKYLLFLILLFLSYLTIFFLSTRSVFISSGLVFLLFILFIIQKPFSYFKVILFFLSTLSISLAFLFNNYLLSDNSNNITDRLQSIQINAESSNFRFYLWENTLDYISNNPFLGCGIGNWKIESLSYWSYKLSDYTVPYHAHNDFLELSTELGLIGGLSYLLIFIFLFFHHVKYILTNKYSLIVFMMLTVYFTDAFFNFPLERFNMQVYFVLIFLFSLVISKLNSNEV